MPLFISDLLFKRKLLITLIGLLIPPIETTAILRIGIDVIDAAVFLMGDQLHLRLRLDVRQLLRRRAKLDLKTRGGERLLRFLRLFGKGGAP